MSLSINNVRGVLSSVSFDNETASKKSAVDTFEMVRGGSFFKTRSSAAGKGGKDSSSSAKEEDAAQNQSQAQNAKEAAAKDESPAQSQSQAQGKEDAAQAQGKY